MKVAIYGAGATGGYLGVKLALAGVDTTLIARGPHLEAMQHSGVRLLIDGDERVAHPVCTGDPAEAGPQDYVIITLKAHSATKVVDAMQPLARTRYGRRHRPERRTLVVLPTRRAASGRDSSSTAWDPGGRQWEGIGPERAIGCVVYVATELAEPGVIRHLYGNRFSLGEPSGEKSARVKTLSRMLAAAGVRAPVRSIRQEIWLKLWGNVSFNPISALTLATLDKVATEAGTRAVARAMMTETREIAEALGIRFRIGLERRMDGAAAVGAHRTSMLQDLEKGRAMEIDALVTSVQELGRLVGVATPTIDLVLALVRQRAQVAGLYPGS